MKKATFHLSLPCKDVIETKKFYTNELGFNLGRSSYSWFDINFYGNQITFTIDEKAKISTNNYDFDDVLLPSFHFGVIIPDEIWNRLYEKHKDQVFFVMASKPFLEKKKGEHKSFFIKDPNGYFIEFKNFIEVTQIFESD